MYDQLHFVNIYISYILELLCLCNYYMNQEKWAIIYNSIIELDLILERGLKIETNNQNILFYFYCMFFYVILPLINVASIYLYIQCDQSVAKLLIAMTIYITTTMSFAVPVAFSWIMISYRYQFLNEILANAKERNYNDCDICIEQKVNTNKRICPLHVLR